MKKLSTLLLALCMSVTLSVAQNNDKKTEKKLYHPEADARADISAAVAKAQKENKHVLLQIGGNWCSWCIAFDKTVNETAELQKMMNDNYVVYHLNHSKEQKNLDILSELGFPQRFGFPVFVVLDTNGIRLHTENSVYLEEGEGHSAKKIMGFLENWSPIALKPEKYDQVKKP